MAILLARIDDRLVHGVVMNNFNAALHPKRFMIIDDQISKDEMIKTTMRGSKPSGSGMSIISEATAIENFHNHKYDDHSVFLITRHVQTLIDLIDAGIKIPKVDIGIKFMSPERTQVSKFVALGPKEKAEIQELQKRNIPVVLQYLPTDPEENIDTYLAKVKED